MKATELMSAHDSSCNILVNVFLILLHVSSVLFRYLVLSRLLHLVLVLKMFYYRASFVARFCGPVAFKNTKNKNTFYYIIIKGKIKLL